MKSLFRKNSIQFFSERIFITFLLVLLNSFFVAAQSQTGTTANASSNSSNKAIVFDMQHPDTNIQELPYDVGFNITIKNVGDIKNVKDLYITYWMKKSDSRRNYEISKTNKDHTITPARTYIHLKDTDLVFTPIMESAHWQYDSTRWKNVKDEDVVVSVSIGNYLLPNKYYGFNVNISYNDKPLSTAAAKNLEAAINLKPDVANAIKSKLEVFNENSIVDLNVVNDIVPIVKAKITALNPKYIVDDSRVAQNNVAFTSTIGGVKAAMNDFVGKKNEIIRDINDPTIKITNPAKFTALKSSLKNDLDALKIFDDTIQISAAAKKLKTQFTEAVDNSVIGGKFDDIIELRRAVDDSIDAFTEKVISIVVEKCVVTVSVPTQTFSADNTKQASSYMNAFAGFGYNAVDKDNRTFAYIGFNMFFRPINKAANPGYYRGCGDYWATHLSVMGGLTFSGFEKAGKSEGLVDTGIISKSALMLGLGYNVNKWININAGYLFYRRANLNPLLASHSDVVGAPFIALAIDLNLKNNLKDIAKNYFKP